MDVGRVSYTVCTTPPQSYNFYVKWIREDGVSLPLENTNEIQTGYIRRPPMITSSTRHNVIGRINVSPMQLNKTLSKRPRHAGFSFFPRQSAKNKLRCALFPGQHQKLIN